MGGLDLSGKDDTSAPAPAEEPGRGTTIGRYTILGPVGRGGVGEVYAAYHADLDRKVALKLMRPGSERDPARAQARLLREAKALARLSHPHVVAVHDAGTFAGRVFIAMEFVDGVTLATWLAERARAPREILAVFTDAARGLAAAHAAGLVHRDFTPKNVMIARDGTVRVTDFGLARSAAQAGVDDGHGGDAPTRAASAPPRVLDLTGTEDLVGTPLYMAPEQFWGRATDASADQFSFCVALYEALYGAPPFGRDDLESLAARVLSGRVEPAPPSSAVPAWLRRVVVRGLEVEPDARWPSMNALIAALERDPARARRRAGLAAGVLALVGLSVATLARGRADEAPLCLGGPARLGAVWEGAGATPRPRRDAVERAFLATGVPGARDVWERAAALLDGYRTRWLAMYRDACEATHVRREQPALALDLRMTCLDERKLALSSLVNVLVTADRDVVKSAVAAANALPTLDRCANIKELTAPVEAPRDDATRARVADLRKRAAIAKALNDTGQHDAATKMARAQLAEARALGYRPLVAEALVAFSKYAMAHGLHPEDVPLEEEGVWTALAVGRDDLAAEAAVMTVGGVGGFLARFDEGHAWARLASSLLDRAGDGHELLRSWLFANEADVRFQQHQPAAALALIERSVALKEKVLPPEHPDVGLTLNNEANALAQLDRNAEALRLNERAHDIFVRAYGAASTEAAYTLSNRGEYLIALGRPAEALEPLRRGLAGWEAQIGPEHQNLAFPLTAQGRALVALGRPKEALPPLERALKLREAGEHDPSMVADTRFALARALWDADAERARAVALAKKARAAYAQAGDAKDSAEVDAWLAGRGETRAP